jgi:hypothetical protein
MHFKIIADILERLNFKKFIDKLPFLAIFETSPK